MKYEIIGNQLLVVCCTLTQGESVFTESGGMAWMDDGFKMESNTHGGLLRGLGRALSGDSLFMTTYTCEVPMATIAFGSSFPGCILPMDLPAGKRVILQKNAFLVAETSVSLEAHLNKKMSSGFIGGEEFILQRIIGPGVAFLEIDGDVVEKELKAGEVLNVDQGYIAAFEDTVDFKVTSVKGLKNKSLSGEGFFMATLTGLGKVWLQTMPFNNLADRILKMIPNK